METVEELLKPRYKVIANYPSMKEEGLEVGSIITCKNYDNDFSEKLWCKMNDAYPHLFKKLAWYEERELSHLPKYLKDAFIPECSVWHKVYKIDLYEHETNTIIANGCKFTLSSFLRSRIPATEEEYLANTNHPIEQSK